MTTRQLGSVLLVVLASRQTSSYSTAAKPTTQPGPTSAATVCSVDNKANPQPLNGTLHQTDYQFTHTSDADSGQPNHFSHILKNDHAQLLLPAKWVKSGIEFERIAVGGCGRNDFDTTLNYSADSDAPVEYGPQAQHKKPASAYVIQQTTAPSQPPGPTAPRLMSRIFALLENQRVDFRFTTFIADGVFHYEAQNNGSQDVPFTIPALTNAWRAIPSATRPAQWSQWSPDRADVFSLTAFQVPRAQEFRVSAPGVSSFREDVVEVAVLSKENLQNRLAVGRVTVYLPVAAR
jgi:hypothetical protein